MIIDLLREKMRSCERKTAVLMSLQPLRTIYCGETSVFPGVQQIHQVKRIQSL